MKFGNWEVKKDAIVWTGHPSDYRIDKNRLHEEGVAERSGKYDWLLHVIDKTWLTRNDIYDLNKAFQHAFNEYGIGEAVNLSWKDTMEHQEQLLKTKD